MGTNGVDVSNHNHGLVDLTKLTGLDFAIAKASEGAHFQDVTYSTWAQQAQAAKVSMFGAYHFFHAETLDGVAQANNFLKSIVPHSGLSMWVDYENAGFGVSGHVDAEVIAAFVNHVKYTIHHSFGKDQKVGLYTNGSGWTRIHPFLSELGIFGLWYAKPTTGVETPGDSVPWNIHQYNEFGGVDRDYSKWSKSELLSLWNW